jgi:hypothetical protein
MGDRDDFTSYADSRRSGEGIDGAEKEPKKIATAAKAFRAVTAVVVFGIPLITGTATLLGYGVYKAYKRITGRS